MSLLELCHELTKNEPNRLPPKHPMWDLLVCPEYSRSVKKVKTYPFIRQDRIFGICWHMSSQNNLYATLRPSPEAFSGVMPYEPHALTQLHTHDYIELGYVAEGEFRQIILGHEITFHQGELCLIDRNCIHQDMLDTGNTTVLFLGIDNDMFSEIIEENGTTKKLVSFLQEALVAQKELQQYLHLKPIGGTDPVLEQEFCDLLTELGRSDAATPYIRKGLLIRIFRTISTHFDFSLTREQKKTMQWLLYEDVLNYIQTHLSDITIHDLVEQFHFQEDYFNRLIKKQTGMTYSAYVRKLRLEKAARLLLHTTDSIEEIAASIGYQNRGFFYRIFEQAYGITPLEYRRRGGETTVHPSAELLRIQP